MAVDQELLNAIELMNQGKEEGFNVLYSRTYNYVYRYAKCLLNNDEDALDLTQETFVQAYKGIGSLRDANNIYSWLGGILKRQKSKFCAKNNREILVYEDAEDIFEDIESTDIESRPEENAQAKATSDIVMSLIEELPELQKAAIMAFYYDNMKIDDIAEIFECSANTIKSRLNYAKKFLKEKVTEHEKQNNYKLCSLSPAIILWALESLFATDGYSLSKATAQAIYDAACGAVGLVPGTIAIGGASSAATVSAATSGVGVSATVTTSAGVSAAATTGISLGAKFGIALAAVAVTGAITTGAYVYTESAKDTPTDAYVYTESAKDTPTAETVIETESTSLEEVEESVSEEILSTPETVASAETGTSATENSDIIENTIEDTIETVAESPQEPQPGDYWRELLTGEYYKPDGSYEITISNVQAPSDQEEDVSFDVYVTVNDSYSGVTQTFNATGVKIDNHTATFEAVSSTGNTWYPELQFMHDGSISFGADVMDPEKGMATISSSYTPIILLKRTRELPLLTDVRISDGTYVYEDNYNKYELTVTNIRDRDDYQIFDLNLIIYEILSTRVFEERIIGENVEYQNGIAAFMSVDDSSGEFFGYLTLLEDGSIALSYDVTDENTDTWVSHYNSEPIILKKQ